MDGVTRKARQLIEVVERRTDSTARLERHCGNSHLKVWFERPNGQRALATVASTSSDNKTAYNLASDVRRQFARLSA
jgi:hypothetical protein